ncbi:polysaccharide pyruvyl transferase family protein [Herbiconiux moechotypicola]|uniref:Polysaccharide pyruvyl transferase family protein n=1 Tax=Herbiconiux moechotypicola TaxID=637393 RepID=A0ABN3DRD4_9MICO|nr:polysaccharide pyruvyl transferase family protein [Herbiconiux moechotypicola]MCS5731494.1 polysaccharide pyruvyl transferase family protein [Herbiconiux moechotypicola]
MSVEVVHWNPSRPVVSGKLGRWVPLRKRVDNFGDLLGPLIVAELVAREHLEEPSDERRLVSVGSIMRMARTGDTVWGTGVNGKSITETLPATALDVRAVRGPLTRSYLQERGIDAPPVFGDPGLLVGHLWDRATLRSDALEADHLVVPNLHDFRQVKSRRDVVNPTNEVWSVLKRIASAEFVVGSSLHGVIVAESFGVPARLVRSTTEPLFKYQDYYAGTGREDFSVAESIDSALEMGGEPLPVSWDSEALIAAFPRDLWSKGPVDGG